MVMSLVSELKTLMSGGKERSWRQLDTWVWPSGGVLPGEIILSTIISQSLCNTIVINSAPPNLQVCSRWHPTQVLWPVKPHGRRGLVGYSPWGREESDTTERLHFHFSLSCLEEGNGNPLQCSCLENPRDGGAWWAAVSGVAQSRTRLTPLSSSSSRWYLIQLCDQDNCKFFKWF